MATTKKKGSFRRNVIATFLVISVLSLGLTGFISYQFIGLIGGYTTDQSSTALENQITTNMKITAEDNADVIGQKLQSAERLVASIAEECEQLLDSDSTYLPRENIYYDYLFRNLTTAPEGTQFEERYGINVSWNYSSWYIPGSDSGNYLTYFTSNQDTIERVSNLDFMFQYVHNQLPEFRWLYVGFENDLWINYPGSDVGGSDTDRTTDPWYPSGDEFYQEIRAGMGEMVYYGPYLDPIDNVLLMSIGRAVYDDTATLRGIVAGDISIENIRTKILDVQVLETGYAALITQSGDILAHPDVDDDVYERYDAQFGRLPTLQEFEVDGTTSALTPVQINQILSGTTDIVRFSKEGEDYILAHTLVEVGGYICIIIVPVSEVLAAIPALEARIAEANMAATLFILTITVAGIVISGAVAVVIANQITGPLQYLMDLATRNVSAMIREEKLDSDDLQVDRSFMDKDDEIGELARAFQGMLDSIKEDDSQ